MSLGRDFYSQHGWCGKRGAVMCGVVCPPVPGVKSLLGGSVLRRLFGVGIMEGSLGDYGLVTVNSTLSRVVCSACPEVETGRGVRRFVGSGIRV